MADKVLIEAAIRRNSTGETRIYRYDVEAQYAEGQAYWWSEGNAGCDCNRHDFFERANGREPDEDEGDCGHTAFAVPWVKAGGEVIYTES